MFSIPNFNIVFLILIIATQCIAVVYKDPDTGFSFSSYDVPYKLDNIIKYRVAIPSSIPQGAGYDAVVQIVSPIEVGWVGLAWRGNMLYSPLTVAWPNGNSAIISPRYTTLPLIDPRTTLEIIPKGTRSNRTHWQYTARCSGCTSFLGRNNFNTTLDPKGTHRLAYGWSKSKPTSTSPSATIGIHEPNNYWYHDFSVAGNSNWDALMQSNLGHS